jgi:hypothetical protein
LERPELAAGPIDHSFGKDARTPQMLGIGGIKPLFGGDDQKTAIECALGHDLGRQFEAFGERRRKISNLRDVEF